jgi:hypothetical protein
MAENNISINLPSEFGQSTLVIDDIVEGSPGDGWKL